MFGYLNSIVGQSTIFGTASSQGPCIVSLCRCQRTNSHGDATVTKKRDDAAVAANPADTRAHAAATTAEKTVAAPTEGAPSSLALNTGKSAKAETETVMRAKASILELSLEARQTAAKIAAFSDRGLVQ